MQMETIHMELASNRSQSINQFLGIYIQYSINWSCHIDYIIPKLSSACYAMRSFKLVMSLNTLKTIYYSCFNAITRADHLIPGLIFFPGIYNT